MNKLEDGKGNPLLHPETIFPPINARKSSLIKEFSSVTF
jgi:hypothetical protein